MNFTYTLNKPPDNNWGSLHLNGSWNGMIKMLQKKDIDFAPASFTVYYERSQVISFANAFTSAFNVLAIKTPSDAYNYQAYIEPLTKWSWICILIFIAVGPMFLSFSLSISRKREEFINPWLLLIGSLGTRASNDWPQRFSSQIATFSLLLFGILGDYQ